MIGLAFLVGAIPLSPVQPTSAPDPPGPTQSYTAFPSADPDDGKFMAVAGQGLQTLAGIAVVMYVGLPEGTSTFEIGIFDGDTSANWDSPVIDPIVVYRLYRDPLKTGSTSSLVLEWRSDTMSNNDWSTKTFITESSAQAPSGNYFYRLDVNWQSPATSTSFNNFKVRTTGQISLRAGQEFGFAGGPQRVPFPPEACDVHEPSFDPPVFRGDPNPGTTNDFDANSYDGQWEWFFYVPTTLGAIAFRDGDSDRANDENSPGQPADDGTIYGACAHIAPSIFYTVTDPPGTAYVNNNPSGNVEWEDFTIGPSPLDDITINYTLQPGLWKLAVEGMDAHNFNVMRAGFEVYSNVTFEASASDVGSDDLTFAWDFGDGASAIATYFNDGVGPDPSPSPEVNPMTAADRAAHAFAAGTHTITLTVSDDDGGLATRTFTIVVG